MNNSYRIALVLMFLNFSFLVNGLYANTQILQIQQSNSGKNIQMKQLGDANEALIIQQMELFNASNNINVTQQGDGNIAQMESQGHHHQTTVAQQGDDNYFIGKVAGDQSETILFQQGIKNRFIQNIESANQVPIIVIQEGFGNEAQIDFKATNFSSEPIQVIQKGIAPRVIIQNKAF